MRKRLLACAVALALALGAAPLPVVAHAESNSAVVTIEVEKRLEGDVPAQAEEYYFALEAIDGAPTPDEAVAKVVGEGTACFPEIVFTAPGTYHYAVRELAGSSDGCAYDDTVYDVTVQVVTDDEGGLSAALWANERGEDGKASDILFVNRYDDSGDGVFNSGGSALFPKTGDSGLALIAALSLLAIVSLAAFVVAFVCRGRNE